MRGADGFGLGALVGLWLGFGLTLAFAALHARGPPPRPLWKLYGLPISSLTDREREMLNKETARRGANQAAE